jgi:hypothetical protein
VVGDQTVVWDAGAKRHVTGDEDCESISLEKLVAVNSVGGFILAMKETNIDIEGSKALVLKVSGARQSSLLPNCRAAPMRGTA